MHGAPVHGRVEKQTAGPLSVTSFMIHLMNFQHLSVIVRVGGYCFYIVPPDKKSNPVSFVCIDQLVVPVLISSNVS